MKEITAKLFQLPIQKQRKHSNKADDRWKKSNSTGDPNAIMFERKINEIRMTKPYPNLIDC